MLVALVRSHATVVASDNCKSFVPVEWDISACKAVVHDLYVVKVMLPMSLDFLYHVLQV